MDKSSGPSSRGGFPLLHNSAWEPQRSRQVHYLLVRPRGQDKIFKSLSLSMYEWYLHFLFYLPFQFNLTKFLFFFLFYGTIDSYSLYMNQIVHPSGFFSDGFDTKVLNWVKTNKSITEFNSVQWWATLQYIVCTLYIVQLQREKLSEAKMGSGASVIVSSQVISLLIISSSLLLSFFCSAVEKRSVWLCSMQCILLSRAIWLGQNNKSSFGISSAHPPPLDHHHHDQKTPLDGDCPKNRSACVIKPRHARIPKPGDSHQHIGVFYICRPVFAIFVYFTWIVFMGPHFHYLQGLGFI